MSDKTLPNDDSDFSLPGRITDSNFPYFEESSEPRSKNKSLVIAAIVFVVISAGVFSYYFVNQNQIDSQILQNTLNLSEEEQLAIEYDVGKFGSDHAHAAIVIFVDDEQINFGLPQFQVQSKYIHFEDHNPYLIHKHATNVPLKMLFLSIGIDFSSECMMFVNSISNDSSLCANQESDLTFIINGQHVSNISDYEISHNDRILISYGDSKSIPTQLEYLESLQIYDVPKKNPYSSGNEIFI